MSEDREAEIRQRVRSVRAHVASHRQDDDNDCPNGIDLLDKLCDDIEWLVDLYA